MARLNVFITNLHAYVCGELRGEWLALPADEEARAAAWERIGSPEEVFFTDYESEDVPGLVERLGEYESLEQLNELAEKLEELEEYELDTLAAVLECGMTCARSAAELAELCEKVQEGEYNLIYGVDTLEELGEYYAEEGGVLERVPEDLRYYFDFEAYGRDIEMETNGSFCGGGWVERVA